MWVLLAVVLLTAQNARPEVRLSSLHFPIVAPNKIIDINATCNATNVDITVTMEKPFKGLIAAKDFSQECRIVGTLEKSVNINIPTSGCGVRMSSNTSDESLYYSVMLVAQQDKHLRQITDQETMVRCRLRDGALSFKSEPMFEAIRSEVNQADAKEYRTGRMRNGWKELRNKENGDSNSSNNPELLDKELENVLGAARAWMEIGPVETSANSERVQVGEATLLSVKSTLPAGIGWRVVDCTAHDGIGEVSQRLLDGDGCPLDETILPALTVTEPRMMGAVPTNDPLTAMRHQEAVASFPAFKFPDRDRLHVTCGLQLCRGRCQPINCRDVASRNSRRLNKGEQGEVLDRLEVFNSVEVLAPGIELEDPRNPEIVSNDGNKKYTTALHIPGDRPFCVSPNKMALAFCILGVIFLVAVIVALCSLMRARRTGSRVPYYSRSLFSSSSGGSGYGGSKLLLHESPSMGQTRHWRIL